MSFDLPSVPTKTHRDENFPVASRLIAARHRPAVLAFYRFARAADDIADDPKLTGEQKLAGLDRFEAALTGKIDDIEAARPLRAILAERGLSPRHALDLLHAFRMDAVKNRYENFDELMHYCAYSAAPVGRFVLDVHGESERTWLASDALCSALQIINHLQDCGADYRKLDRVYIPLDALAEAGADVKALGAEKASPALLSCLHRIAAHTDDLVQIGKELPRMVQDLRLCLETAVIGRLAQILVKGLLHRDPLSDKVHLSKPHVLVLTLFGIGEGLAQSTRRAGSRVATTGKGL
ncbi:MAG: squalene synthase HpnC [Beijerinckiaceae bacterium]|nr:MAG: squalene synthase HpnC [Beijerinckiaceae bacterium]